MGRYKFKLSDMIPNAWFYKMKDMNQNRSRNPHQNTLRKRGFHLHHGAITPRRSFTSPTQTPKQPLTPNRASYYYSTRVVEERRLPNSPTDSPKRLDTNIQFEPARRSSKTSPRRRVKLTNANKSYATREKYDQTTSFENNSEVRISSDADIILEMANKTPDLGLSPIITRSEPCRKTDHSFDPKNEARIKPKKKKSPRTPRKMCKSKSPIVSQKRSNEGFKESFAVVKSSKDPQMDFRESMIEMIVENNMQSLDDLEELLACYLSLNSREYHGVIVRVFKQIWLDFNNARM